MFSPLLKKRATSSDAFNTSHSVALFSLFILPFKHLSYQSSSLKKFVLPFWWRERRGKFECESAVACLTKSAKAPEIGRPFEPQLETDGGKDWWVEREDPLPPLRSRPVVRGFYGQSVIPPHSELNAWRHSNNPGAVNTDAFMISRGSDGRTWTSHDPPSVFSSHGADNYLLRLNVRFTERFSKIFPFFVVLQVI